MRQLYRILFFATVLVAITVAVSVRMFFFGYIPMDVCPVPIVEGKIEMGQVSFDSANPKNFQINVKLFHSSQVDNAVVFTDAIFKNNTGDVVAFGNLQKSKLEPGTEMTLDISTDIDLPSGNYTITLVTTGGSSFVSSIFTKP